MAQIISICVMPIVTRLYTPAEIGVITLFIAFFGFWAPTLSLRYEFALLIAESDAQSHVVHRLAMLAVVVMSLIGVPIVWGLHKANVLGFGLLPGWAPLAVAPILLGYGIFMVSRAWALRAGMVKPITTATVERSAWSAATRVVLGLLGGGVAALFAAQLMASWAAMIALGRHVRRYFAASQPDRISLREVLQAAKRYVKFAVFETPSSWVDQLAMVLPVPMIVSLYGISAAGWFGLARTIVSIPNAQVGTAVADVFQMEIASAIVEGNAWCARELFYKLMRKLALWGLVPLSGVVILCPLLVPWIFGQTWREAGYISAIIAFWLYAGLIVSPLSRVLSVLQMQEYKLVYDFVSVALLGLAFLLAKTQHFALLGFIAAISLAAVLAYVVYLLLIVMVFETRLRRMNCAGG